VLAFSEWYRAINLVDITKPSEPNYFNCQPYLGRSLDQVAKLDDKLICSSEKFILLLDVKDPNNIKEVQRLNMGSTVEGIACENGVAYVANDKRGLVLLSLQNGLLVESSRYLETESFQPQQVFLSEQRIYPLCYGGDDDRDYWVLNKKDPTQVLLACDKEGGTPNLIRELDDKPLCFTSTIVALLVKALTLPRSFLAN